MKIGVAADHGGFELKEVLAARLREAGHEVTDFGATVSDPRDDYPDFVRPLAGAVSRGEVERGIAVCGSGVGASVVANKVRGVRAAVMHDPFCARQGVEDDDISVMCLGARIVGQGLAWDLVQVFLNARFSEAERHNRRLAKIRDIEQGK